MRRIFTKVFVRKSKKTIDIAEVSGGEGRRGRGVKRDGRARMPEA